MTGNVKSPMGCPFDQDLALVHACKSGNAAAFEELVKRYDTKLFRIAQHITHNREDAQDAVQEAFLKVFRKLTQFQENSKFSTWLTRITVNESLMKLRKQRHNKEFSIDNNFESEDHSLTSELADCPSPIATEFETIALGLGLTKETYLNSNQLRRWCERNNHRCYIPEWLLKEWGILPNVGWS